MGVVVLYFLADLVVGAVAALVANSAADVVQHSVAADEMGFDCSFALTSLSLLNRTTS